MKRFLLIFVLGFIASFFVAANALAHEPRFIQDDQLVVIKNSDVSQAFYGELRDRPAYYLVDLKKAQDLYFQILAPDLPGIQKDKTVIVEYAKELDKAATPFLKIEPGLAVWQKFYEEYAGDNYFAGPSVTKPAEAGYYIIQVSSPDNTGKYVLVVGEKEDYSAPEMAKALIVIPQLKTQFFNKPVWQSFNGKIGKYFGLGLAVLVVFFFVFHKFRQIYK